MSKLNRSVGAVVPKDKKIADKKLAKQRTSQQQCLHMISIFLLATVLSFFIVLMKAYVDGEFTSAASLQAYIGRYGMFGPVFLTAFQAMQVVVPMLPGFLGCAVGSVMFGPTLGFWCNYIGIGAGSVIAFLLARKFGLPLLQDLFPLDKYDKWSKWASRSKSYTGFLFMAMLLPLFPDDFLCYLTGITKMTAKRFIWIIIIGKPWCILAYSLGFSLID